MDVNSKKRPVESSSEAEDSSSSEEALQQEPQPTLQPPQQPQNVDADDDDEGEEEESDDPEKADAKKTQSESESEEEESEDPEKADAMVTPGSKKPQSESESESEEEESDDPGKADAKKPQSEYESESEEEEKSDDPEKADAKKPQSESESEEEEESEDHEKADAMVTQASKKPQSESESEDDDEESDSPEPVTPPNKRALENAESSKNNKKAKVSDSDGKIGGSAVDDSKKSAINRVWSEKDEILLLEEYHAFMTKNGRDSITNLTAFHQTLKDLDMSLDVTKSRLYEKIRRLRNKFLKNMREQTVFSKPHEEKLYKISEKIWGGEVDVIENSGLRKSKRKKKVGKKSGEKDICKMEEANNMKKDGGSSFPRLVASLESQASKYLPVMAVDPKEFANNMVLKFGKKKAKELEEGWKEYGLMEARLYASRVEITSNQVNVLLDALKP